MTRVLLIAFVALFALATAASARAVGQDLGELTLHQPCCSGAALQGARAYIHVPLGFGNVPFGEQALELVAAQDGVTQPGELGITEDNNLVADGDPNCYKPYSLPVGFYEWFDYVNTTVRCKALGQAVSDHLYSVAQQSNNNFQFFVDGSPQLASPLIKMMGTYKPNAYQVAAGGEVVWDAVEQSFEWEARFAGAGNTPWQRFNNTLGWVTIQSNNGSCNGPPVQCTGGRWFFDTTSFPTTWGVLYFG